MKRKITVYLFMLVSVLRFSLSAMAADGPCGQSNQNECASYALTKFQTCIGSDLACLDQYHQDYNGCMILKGCASPPPFLF